VMCSTCGHGDFPQNASLFWSNIGSPDVAPASFKDMRYCTFSMGDRSYADSFCEAGKLIDQRLGELGGKKVMDMGIGDDRDEDKWETGFNKWLPEFWTAVKAAEPQDDGSPKTPLFEIKYHDGSDFVPKQLCPPGASLLKVGESTRMTPAEYSRDVRHFSLSTTNVDFPFDLGDAIACYYENLPEDVDEALKWFGYDGNAVVTVACDADKVSERHTKAFQQRVTVKQIMTEMLDLFGRPTKSVLTDLARYANNKERKILEQLSKPDNTKAMLDKIDGATALLEGMKEWKDFGDASMSYFDIFKKFASAKPALDHLMSIIPLCKPRLYSIASSNDLKPDVLDLTIVINQWKAPGTGKMVTGACTKFIQRVPVGACVAAQAVVGTFKFPKEDTTPMVMVGLGTGIAPIRSFLEDKLFKKCILGIETGPMHVFYGCRHYKEELFYKEDWARFEAAGVLTSLTGAFQLDDPKKQVFVGDKMAEKPEIITDNLLNKGGFFYMCGPAVATPSVQAALRKAVSDLGKKGDAGAVEWFEGFQRDGRYSEESY